jgi:hypothetical protein
VSDYWLDANTFIESMKGPYGFDIAPGFWAAIDRKAREGIVTSCTLVYEELLNGDDELVQWSRDRKQILFVEPDEAVQGCFRQIADHVNENYDRVQADRFLAGADPWIIACAKAHGGTVVTREKRVPVGSRKAKVPNVCDHFGVACLDVYDMLRRIGVSLS